MRMYFASLGDAPSIQNFTETTYDGKPAICLKIPGVSREELEVVTEAYDKPTIRIKVTPKDGNDMVDPETYVAGLSAEWDISSAECTLKDGVLYITFSKDETKRQVLQIQ